MKTTIFAVLILAGLAQLAPAQTHNVVLIWHDTVCAAGVVSTTSGPCNQPGTTYNAYKAIGTCPLAGTNPAIAVPPFAQIASGLTVASYIDINAIQVGQTFCYYVTAVFGSIIVNGVAKPNESGQATMRWPLSNPRQLPHRTPQGTLPR